MAWVHEETGVPMTPAELLNYYRRNCRELSDTKAQLNFTRLNLVRAKAEADAEEREGIEWREKEKKWKELVEESRQWGWAWSQKQEAAMKKAEAARLAAPHEYRKYCLVISSGSAARTADDVPFTVRVAPEDAAPPVVLRGSPVVLHNGSTVWGCEPTPASDMIPDVAEGKWLKVKLNADDWRLPSKSTAAGGGTTNKRSGSKPKREVVGFVLKAPNLNFESCFKPYAEAMAEARGRTYVFRSSSGELATAGDLVQISSGVAYREIKPSQGRLLVVSPWPSRFDVGPFPAAADGGGPPSEQEVAAAAAQIKRRDNPTKQNDMSEADLAAAATQEAAAAKQEKSLKALAAHKKKVEDEERRRAKHVWCFHEPPLPLPQLPPQPGRAARKAFEKLQKRRATLKEELEELKELVSQLRGAVLAQGDGMKQHEEHWEKDVVGEQLRAFTVERTVEAATMGKNNKAGAAAAAAVAAGAAAAGDAQEAIAANDALLPPPLEAAVVTTTTTTTTTTTLAVHDEDFPMKIYFLDKSGSMGCNDFTKHALGLASVSVMEPEQGSNLVFFLAAPGETQVFHRRPGDDPMEGFSVELGSGTWFNEPLVRTLLLIAAGVEDLDVEAWSATHRGVPPVQVICMTDGQDNMSPLGLSALGDLVEAVGTITGPRHRQPLYQPVTSRQEAAEVIASQRRGPGGVATKVPVFLCWLLLGQGGQQFLESDVPRGVVYVNLSNVAGGGDLRVPSGPMATSSSGRNHRRRSAASQRKTPKQKRLVAAAAEGGGDGDEQGQANVSDEYEDCDDDDGRSFFAVDANEEQLLLCAIGTRVLVAPNGSGSAGSLPSLKGGGKAMATAAEAIVIETGDNEDSGTTVTVLYADERTESHVVPQRLHQAPTGCLVAGSSNSSNSSSASYSSLPSQLSPASVSAVPSPPLMRHNAQTTGSGRTSAAAVAMNDGALSTGEGLQVVHLATTNPEGLISLISIMTQPDEGKSKAKKPSVGAAKRGVTIDVARHPNRAQLFAPPLPPNSKKKQKENGKVYDIDDDDGGGGVDLPPSPPSAAVIPALDPAVLAASQRCVERSIRTLAFAAPPAGFLLGLMATVGDAAVKARFDDEERGLAQILAHTALASLASGRSVTTDERLYQTTVDRIQSLRAAGSGAALQWRPSRGCLEGDQDGRRKWQRLLVSIAEVAMGLLADLRVLSRTNCDGGGGGGGGGGGFSEAGAAMTNGTATSIFTAFDPELPALAAALRFLDPVVNPFCLSRCMARKHRGQLMPSFNQRRPRTASSSSSSSNASEDDGSASLVPESSSAQPSPVSTPRSSLLVAGSTATEAASTPGTTRQDPKVARRLAPLKGTLRAPSTKGVVAPALPPLGDR